MQEGGCGDDRRRRDYPYGKDPHDSNIRIAPTYPPLGDLVVATELFALCVKLTSAEKLLKEMENKPRQQRRSRRKSSSQTSNCQGKTEMM